MLFRSFITCIKYVCVEENILKPLPFTLKNNQDTTGSKIAVAKRRVSSFFLQLWPGVMPPGGEVGGIAVLPEYLWTLIFCFLRVECFF